MSEVGRDLFPSGARWERLSGRACAAAPRPKETRIEVETQLEDAPGPMGTAARSGLRDLPLALDVPSFVRCPFQTGPPPNPPPAPAAGKIRILLVICRLEDDPGVPFRSVARYLIRGLSDAVRESVSTSKSCGPPTFEQLAKRLRGSQSARRAFPRGSFRWPRVKRRSVFRKPQARTTCASGEGRCVGQGCFTKRACRFSFSMPAGPRIASHPSSPGTVGDLHQQIRQFGSFAHAVMDYGATGVVAWRYSVFVRYSRTVHGRPICRAGIRIAARRGRHAGPQAIE